MAVQHVSKPLSQTGLHWTLSAEGSIDGDGLGRLKIMKRPAECGRVSLAYCVHSVVVISMLSKEEEAQAACATLEDLRTTCVLMHT